MTPPSQRAPGPGADWLPALVWGLTAGSLLAWLQIRLHYVGQPHSFDSMLYARGLWGLAHDAPVNSVVGVHAWAVHGHFHLALLAPLTRLLPALDVLIGLQSLAFGATVGLVSHACAKVGGAARIGWLAGAAVVIGSPLVVNPFLFDVRPGIAAVPVLVWAGLRARERGRLDAPALGALAAAALMREEWALVAGGALLAWPLLGARRVASWQNAVAALGMAGYYAFYWFVLREALGGSFAVERVSDVPVTFLARESLGWAALAGYKLELVALAAATLGGAAALGRRGWLLALPGLVFVLASNRMAPEAASVHYPMLAAPGLLVAGVEGVGRVAAWARARRRWAPGAAVLVIVLTYALSSALPGGGRFRRENFLVGGWSDSPPLGALDNHTLAESRALIGAIPDGEGAAVEYVVASGLVDRPVLWSLERLARAAAERAALPPELTWVALLESRWSRLGRRLVTQHGFGVVGLVPGGIALLARDPGWERLAPPGADAVCAAPLAVWPGAGLALCDASTSSAGRWRLSVCRVAPERAGATRVVVVGSEAVGWTPADALGGLFNLRDLAQGRCAWLETPTSVEGSAEAMVVGRDGGVVPAARPDGAGPQSRVLLPGR